MAVAPIQIIRPVSVAAEMKQDISECACSNGVMSAIVATTEYSEKESKDENIM